MKQILFKAVLLLLTGMAIISCSKKEEVLPLKVKPLLPEATLLKADTPYKKLDTPYRSVIIIEPKQENAFAKNDTPYRRVVIHNLKEPVLFSKIDTPYLPKRVGK
jgi:hypothetical protein